MTLKIKATNEHLYFCAGISSEVVGGCFSLCLPGGRGPGLDLGMYVLVYLMHVSLQVPQNQIAKLTYRNHQILPKYLAKVTNLRDELPSFDEKMSNAEMRVRSEFNLPKMLDI